MKRPALKSEIKLGAEPKRVAVLIGLLVVGGIVYLINSGDTPSNPAPARTSNPAVSPPALPSRSPARPSQRAAGRVAGNGGQERGGSLQQFRPTLKPKDDIDPSRIDPTLKLGLLARLKTVAVEGGGRSLFDFAGAPPAAAEVEIAKVKPIIPGSPSGFIGPIEPKAAPPAPKPPPPPIPLKFYGFNTMKQGTKRAFFLEGDDIFVAGEGELIKNRYKVVRIGINSAVVEDTTNKHEQTLPLEAEQVSS
jgi:hypothetical protein